MDEDASAVSVALNLTSNGLAGTLPPDFFAALGPEAGYSLLVGATAT